MRSEEVEKAINNLMFIVVTDIYDNEVSIDKSKIINEYNESVGKVLSYISELEKENENYRKLHINIQGMRSGKELLTKYINDSILKDVIRDKIKELEQTKGDFATYIAVSERIQVLKELLGE